jgi:hypothetical protein
MVDGIPIYELWSKYLRAEISRVLSCKGFYEGVIALSRRSNPRCPKNASAGAISAADFSSVSGHQWLAGPVP